MTDREKIEKLLDACRTYHNALDIAFAMLINATRGKSMEPFMPSRSIMWPAMELWLLTRLISAPGANGREVAQRVKPLLDEIERRLCPQPERTS
jgi:hypothetical protein